MPGVSTTQLIGFWPDLASVHIRPEMQVFLEAVSTTLAEETVHAKVHLEGARDQDAVQGPC